MNFYKYIKKRYGGSYYNRFGYLVKDILEDGSFPKNVHYKKDEYAVMKGYLQRKGASYDRLEQFTELYHKYLREQVEL